MSRAAFTLAGLAGLGAVIALAIWARAPLAVLIGRIGAVEAPFLLAALALTIGNLALSVVKLNRLNPHPAPFASAMAVTAGGALLGNVMPVQAAISAARAGHARLLGQPAGEAAAHSVHEQAFDALLVLAAALAAALWVVAGAGVAIIGFFLALAVFAFLMGRMFGLGARLFGAKGRIADWLAQAARLPGATARFLLAASALRYLLTLLRALAVMAALGLTGAMAEAAAAYPLIQIAGVLPLSPGGLGVVEAGWTGVLTAAGVALPLAAGAAVAMRAAIMLCQMATLAIFAAMALAWRRR